jgi:hypothetical protein
MEKKRLSNSFYGAALVCMVCCSFASGTTLETTAAWQVSGKVTDVHGNAIGGAQVCPQGSATGCVTTATNGTFSISGNAVGVRLDPSAQPSGKAVTLAARNGKLFLGTPGALSGKLELFDASGVRLAIVNDISLSHGENRIDAPIARLGSTMLLLRLSCGPMEATWKIVLGGTGGFPAVGKVGQPQALGKVTAASFPVITAGKTGYTLRNYYATSAADAQAWILLAATGDDSTYKFQGTSYPATAIPPNVLFGQANMSVCPTAYAGKKVGELLGYGVSNCCGAITFNNIYAPKDSTYLITFSYMCAGGDNDGDSNCGGTLGTNGGLGCRPIQFVINGDSDKVVFQTPCYANTNWCLEHFDSTSIPLKAGLNSIHLWSKTSDMPDLSRIIIKDGRAY